MEEAVHLTVARNKEKGMMRLAIDKTSSQGHSFKDLPTPFIEMLPPISPNCPSEHDPVDGLVHE